MQSPPAPFSARPSRTDPDTSMLLYIESEALGIEGYRPSRAGGADEWTGGRFRLRYVLMWDEFTVGLLYALALWCSALAGVALAPALADVIATLTYGAAFAWRAARRWVRWRLTGR